MHMTGVTLPIFTQSRSVYVLMADWFVSHAVAAGCGG